MNKDDNQPLRSFFTQSKKRKLDSDGKPEDEPSKFEISEGGTVRPPAFGKLAGGMLPRKDKWIFATLAEAIFQANVKSQSGYHDDTLASFSREIDDLEEIVCQECEGFGHTKKKCPTYAKIVKMCAGIKSWKHTANTIRQYINSSAEQTALAAHTTMYKDKMFDEKAAAKDKDEV